MRKESASGGRPLILVLGVTMDSFEPSEETILLEMYKVQVARSEHFERMRASISSLLFLVAAALVGLVASSSETARHIKMISVLVMFIGLFGLAASAMHARRARRHGLVATSYRRTLAEIYPRFGEANERVPREPTYLNALWATLHGAIISLGILLFFLGGLGDA